MYSNNFCKVYNEFGWNYFPEAFGQQLLEWMKQREFNPKSMLDIGCGTGILCDILQNEGIKASGMDLSEGMIEIARREHPDCRFDVADMVTYRPGNRFDLVTCTGDALNHILELEDVKSVMENVYYYLNDGGYFIFDILNERETGDGEPIDLNYSETVKAQFRIQKKENNCVTLSVSVYENGILQIKEEINEIVHEPEIICEMLKVTGFREIILSDRLLEGKANHSTTWYVIAKK